MLKNYLVGAISAVMLIACGGGGTDGGTPPITTPPTPAIALSLSSTSGSLTVPASRDIAVNLVRSGGYTGAVTITVGGLPTGMSATVTPAVLDASTASASIRLTASATTPSGQHTLTVSAAGAGVASVSTTYQATAVVITPDFSLRVATETIQLHQGASGTIPLQLVRTGGFRDTVTVVALQATTPAIGGIDVSFPQTRIAGADSVTSVATSITIDPSVAVGTYALRISGASPSVGARVVNFTLVVTAPPSAGVLSASASTVNAVQGGATAPVRITLARSAGVAGVATFSLEQLPPFVTGTFTPNPTSGDTTRLVLNVGINHPSGGVTVRVRVTIGDATATIPIALNTSTFVPPDFVVTLGATAIAVAAGSSTNIPITIGRTGGYTGAVTLALQGAPLGLSASVTPSPIVGETATLTVSATAGVGAGLYPIVVAATGVGLTGTRTVPLSVTVNTSGVNTVAWRFCDPSRVPLWFGTRSGTAGAWTRVVAGANNTFSFAFPANGQVAYVQSTTRGPEVRVHSMRPDEVLAVAARECATYVARKTITGTLANVDIIQGVFVAAGGADTTAVRAPTAFTLTDVSDRMTDLVALRGTYTAASGFSNLLRIIVRRNINPAAGSALPVLDFDGSEWTPSAGDGITLLNLGAETATVETALFTANGFAGTYFRDTPSNATSRTAWGLAPADRLASDLTRWTATTTHAVTPRRVVHYRSDLNFFETPFGATLAAPTVTVIGSNPLQLQATGLWTAEYGHDVVMTYRQDGGADGRTVTLDATRAFVGSASSSWSLSIPDFTTAPGWNSAWMLRSGTPTTFDLWVSGLRSGASTTPANDVMIRSAGRRGTIVP